MFYTGTLFTDKHLLEANFNGQHLCFIQTRTQTYFWYFHRFLMIFFSLFPIHSSTYYYIFSSFLPPTIFIFFFKFV
jgi:hypothetical protein